MKWIVMEQTINWMLKSGEDPNTIKEWIDSGTTAQTESGMRYLLVEIKNETQWKENM